MGRVGLGVGVGGGVGGGADGASGGAGGGDGDGAGGGGQGGEGGGSVDAFSFLRAVPRTSNWLRGQGEVTKWRSDKVGVNL